MMEAEIFDDPTLSMQALRAAVGVTAQANLKNGKIYNLYNAFQVGKLELDAVAGKFQLQFSGTDMNEITTS